MKKYKVTGKSKCRVFDGFVPGVQANGQPIHRIVEIVFDENGIGEADESVNISSWLREGFIVELKPNAVVEQKKTVDAPAPVKEEPVPVVVPNEQVDEESDDADYEELEDGTFRCLRCKDKDPKIFKTEGRVIAHVEKVHGRK